MTFFWSHVSSLSKPIIPKSSFKRPPHDCLAVEGPGLKDGWTFSLEWVPVPLYWYFRKRMTFEVQLSFGKSQSFLILWMNWKWKTWESFVPSTDVNDAKVPAGFYNSSDPTYENIPAPQQWPPRCHAGTSTYTFSKLNGNDLRLWPVKARFPWWPNGFWASHPFNIRSRS